MHKLLLEEIVALCKRRQAQGDHPQEPPASVETLEDAIVQLSAVVGVAPARLSHVSEPDKQDQGVERAALREALERIVKACDWKDVATTNDGYNEACLEMDASIEAARAALAAHPGVV